MQRDQVYLLDILEAAKLAISYGEGVEKEDFINDIQLQDSVVRRIEIVGEASRRISENTRSELPQIPWHEMIGMRNLVIHEYDDLDLNILWQTLKNDLLKLVEHIEPLFKEEK